MLKKTITCQSVLLRAKSVGASRAAALSGSAWDHITQDRDKARDSMTARIGQARVKARPPMVILRTPYTP